MELGLPELQFMAYPFPPDLQQLVADRLASGRYRSEDDMLREAMHVLAAQEDDLFAVQEAIAAWKAGDEGIPVKEAFEIIRNTFAAKV